MRVPDRDATETEHGPSTSEPAQRGASLARRLLDLTAAFARVGLFGFGGGPAFLPLIQREVERRGWLSREDYIDALAFGNALPGPITTKLAGYVGHRVAGPAGASVALLGLAVPTIVAMIALASLYALYGETPAVVAFLTGLRPVVIALLVVVVVTFVPSALLRTDRTFARLLLCVGAFALAVGAGVHPAVLIVAGGVVGATVLRST